MKRKRKFYKRCLNCWRFAPTGALSLAKDYFPTWNDYFPDVTIRGIPPGNTIEEDLAEIAKINARIQAIMKAMKEYQPFVNTLAGAPENEKKA